MAAGPSAKEERLHRRRLVVASNSNRLSTNITRFGILKMTLMRIQQRAPPIIFQLYHIDHLVVVQ